MIEFARIMISIVTISGITGVVIITNHQLSRQPDNCRECANYQRISS